MATYKPEKVRMTARREGMEDVKLQKYLLGFYGMAERGRRLGL